MKAILQGAVLFAIIGYLFYDSWFSLFLVLPLFPFYLRSWQEEQCKKKKQDFRRQFGISIQAMASALSTGYSIENAIREAARDTKQVLKKDSRICMEFQRMIRQLEMNQPVESIMSEFARRVEQEDVHNFVIVFTAAKRSGGDSIQILRSAAKAISEKIETEKEIQTLLAAKKLEFKVMCVVPLGILFYMRISFQGFMDVLYGNLFGAVLMTASLGIYAAAYHMGKKLVEIEV